jgi:thioester reductase-like protein
MQIYCLIRAKNIEAARKRLHGTLQGFGITLERKYLPRAHFIAGDISQPRFGLDSSSYAELSANIDVVYHCASEVHFLKRYQELKPSNVLGTVEIIKFVVNRKLKVFHHISTIGVFGYRYMFESRVLKEKSLLEADWPHDTEIGYNQSKWVAERLVTEAFARGVPGIIYRPGAIGCHSRLDIHNDKGFLALMFRCCKAARSFPDFDWKFPYGTLDWTCRAILHISNHFEKNSGRVFHVFKHTLSFHDFHEILVKASLEKVGTLVWKNRLLSLHEAKETSSIEIMKQLFSKVFYKNYSFFELPHESTAEFSNLETVQALKGLEFLCGDSSDDVSLCALPFL